MHALQHMPIHSYACCPTLACHQAGDIVEGTVLPTFVLAERRGRPNLQVDVDDGLRGSIGFWNITHDESFTRDADAGHDQLERLFPPGSKVKAVVQWVQSHVSLSMAKLERRPGDVLRDPQRVFEHAERNLAENRKRQVAVDRLLEKEEVSVRVVRVAASGSGVVVEWTAVEEGEAGAELVASVQGFMPKKKLADLMDGKVRRSCFVRH